MAPRKTDKLSTFQVPDSVRALAMPVAAFAAISAVTTPTQDAVAGVFETPQVVPEMSDPTLNEHFPSVDENGNRFFSPYSGFNLSGFQGLHVIPAGQSNPLPMDISNAFWMLQPDNSGGLKTMDGSGNIYTVSSNGGDWTGPLTNSMYAQRGVNHNFDGSIGFGVDETGQNDVFSSVEHLGGSDWRVELSDGRTYLIGNIARTTIDLERNRFFYDDCGADLNALDCDVWEYDTTTGQSTFVVANARDPYFDRNNRVLYVSKNDGTYNNPDFNVYTMNEIVPQAPDLDAPVFETFTGNGDSLAFAPLVNEVNCQDLDDVFAIETYITDPSDSDVTIETSFINGLGYEVPNFPFQFDPSSGRFTAEINFLGEAVDDECQLTVTATDSHGNETVQTVLFRMVDYCEVDPGEDNVFTEDQFPEESGREVVITDEGETIFDDIVDDFTANFDDMDIYAEVGPGDSSLGIDTGITDRTSLTGGPSNITAAAQQYLSVGHQTSDRVAILRAISSTIELYDATGFHFATLQPGQWAQVSGDYIHPQEHNNGNDTDAPKVDETDWPTAQDTGDVDSDTGTGFVPTPQQPGCEGGCSQSNYPGTGGFGVALVFVAAGFMRRRREDELQTAKQKA